MTKQELEAMGLQQLKGNIWCVRDQFGWQIRVKPTDNPRDIMVSVFAAGNAIGYKSGLAEAKNAIRHSLGIGPLTDTPRELLYSHEQAKIDKERQSKPE